MVLLDESGVRALEPGLDHLQGARQDGAGSAASTEVNKALRESFFLKKSMTVVLPSRDEVDDGLGGYAWPLRGHGWLNSVLFLSQSPHWK